jgi:predicted metalloprotease
MMGRQNNDQGPLFYEFCLDEAVPDDHLVRKIDAVLDLSWVYAFKYGLINKVKAGQPTIKRIELQADYFAGYFAGLRKRERPSYPAAVVALAQRRFGDTAYNNEQHHGTPLERGAAVVRGFEASFRENKNFYDAIQESTQYVLQL